MPTGTDHSSLRPRARGITRRGALLAIGGVGLLGAGAWGWGAWAWARRAGPPVQVTREASALGAEMSITVFHPRRAAAEEAIARAYEQIRQVDALMSLYRPDSQICTLNRTGVLDNPHPWMVDVLQQCQAVSLASGGAFDITIQPLWELYWSASRNKQLPGEPEVAAARSRVDWRKIEVTPSRVRFRGEKMAITLNAIAQGFALDQALASLRRDGIAHALVDAGEIGSIGSKPDGRPWTAGIQHPRQRDAYIAVIQLDGRCISTSGDYATKFSDDYAYHHIFNPATGKSPQVFSSVTIAAPRGAQADALSTAVFVLGLEKGIAMIESLAQTDAMLVLKDGRVLKTKGFPPPGAEDR